MPNLDKKEEIAGPVQEYLDFMEDEWKLIKQKAEEQEAN